MMVSVIFLLVVCQRCFREKDNTIVFCLFFWGGGVSFTAKGKGGREKRKEKHDVIQ